MALVNPKTNWNSLNKFNYEDLNKIENNINETLLLLQTINPYASILDIKTNRDYTSVDFAESLNRIEGNIKELRDLFSEPYGWIKPKTDWKPLHPFSFVDANRLEIDINLLYESIQLAKQNFQYCGAFNCGDDTRIF